MIYTPADLQSDAFADNAPKFAVFGKPIAHSLSPVMQNAALAELAKADPRFARARYDAFEVDSAELNEILPLFAAKNFVGINLTIPHKETVLPALAEADAEVLRARACNTLLKTPSGWRGFNTDGFGLETAIQKAFGVDFENAEVVILGAGGAARGAAFRALAKKCGSLSVANRSRERLQKLADDIRAEGFDCNALELSQDLEIPENAIVVNATSIGLKPDDAPVLDFSKFPRSAVFFDMPYRRGAETNSVVAARGAGVRAASGLPMLAWQGAKSLSIWTGADVESAGKTMLKSLGL